LILKLFLCRNLLGPAFPKTVRMHLFAPDRYLTFRRQLGNDVLYRMGINRNFKKINRTLKELGLTCVF
jgi:hypothetical protein